MLSTKNKIKLAKMLSLVKEIKDQNGNTIVADEEFAVGVEVFQYDENGELVPCQDGEYIYNDETIYVVESGKIKEIREYVNAETTETQVVEEEMAEETQENTENEGDKDAKIKDLEEKLADKDTQIEDLNKKIEEINASNVETIDLKDKQISDLQATIKELEDKIKTLEEEKGKSVDEPIETKMSRVEEKHNNVMELLKNRRK